ncbi:peptidase [Streptomyces sp. ISL-66]|uniref:peptidase n=1 Tax=Streptomyces sp. ISL-66 TaxID=2819186 RepID=UPI001BE96D5B|nr:peptidase [Streptomyces sp. ISL-66]MBT2467664.1 peptidase [Streptomyces sp. ISL-66]
MRTSLLAAVGLMAVGLTAAPAHAADPVFTLSGPAEIGLRPHPGQSGEPQKTTVDFRVANETGTVFDRQSTYTIDLSALKGVADVAFTREQHNGCTLAAAKVTCKAWSIWTHGSQVVSLDLAAAKDSKVGAVVDLTMTGSAEGATFKPITTKVKVGGPDLVLEEAPLKPEMVPGQTQALPIVLSNAGTESARGVALELDTTHGIDLVEKYDNCSYSVSDTPGQPWNTGWGTTICTFADEIKPGTVYETAEPLTLKAAPHAFFDAITYAVYENGDQPKTTEKLAPSATTKKLTLKERPARAAALRSADLDPWNNYHEFAFSVKNSADLVAGAVSLKGKAGETVKAELGFQNNGPAWVAYLRSGEAVARTDIVIPAGVKVTKAPEQCRGFEANGEPREQNLGAPRYHCSTTHVIGEKQKFAYPFELKIEKVIEGATGSISVGQWADDTPVQDWDPNKANNRAAFVINGKDAGTTPTTGPSTGTGTPTQGASATAAATTSASASASAVPGAGKGPKANGGLASTGSTALPVAIGGAALVAAGGALYVAVRRRAAARA